MTLYLYSVAVTLTFRHDRAGHESDPYALSGLNYQGPQNPHSSEPGTLTHTEITKRHATVTALSLSQEPPRASDRMVPRANPNLRSRCRALAAPPGPEAASASYTLKLAVRACVCRRLARSS